jgi:type IV pilus assembly protein PilM
MSRLRHGFGAQGLLAGWLASPPPDAAIEIAAERIVAAAVSARGDGLAITAHASEPLAPGVVTPSLTGANVNDRQAAAAALRRVLERLGSRPRRVALVIPDTAVKVSLLRFEKVPARRDDFEQLVRWQLRKAAPFPVEVAAVTWAEGAAVGPDGREFVVELAREEAVREYEAVCDEAGLYAGLVDIATFGLLGLFDAGLAGGGDCLLVHVRPDYTSMAIMRGDDLIFYRHRPEDGEDGLPDLVHQTAMYYQDRLAGHGFVRVLLAGGGGIHGAAEAARRSLEERLGVPVEPLDPTRAATLTDRITASPGLMEVLGPVVGLVRRTHAEAVRA